MRKSITRIALLLAVFCLLNLCACNAENIDATETFSMDATSSEMGNTDPSSTEHGHDYYIANHYDPSCTMAGFTAYRCICGESYIEDLAAAGHCYAEEIVDPSANALGYTLHMCICGDFYMDHYITLADKQYADRISGMGIFDSSISQAMPQTVVHKLVMEHFSSESEGIKKAIVIGYDGFRTDALENIQDLQNSAVMYLKEQGGLYHTFSGGVRETNEQLTESGPSWVSVTTGGWANYTGMTEQMIPKNDAKTFLTELAEKGYSGAFTVSYPEHLSIIFQPDVEYAQNNQLPIEYTCQSDDDATNKKILEYVTKIEGEEKTAQKDPDVIFYTLEDVDMTGHFRTYGSAAYNEACTIMDTEAYAIIKAIENRSTYSQEDWLIIITTDHGGEGHTHETQTNINRMTWLACNKPIPLLYDNLNYAREGS